MRFLSMVAVVCGCSTLPTTPQDASVDDATSDTTLPDAGVDAPGDASDDAPSCEAGLAACSGSCVPLTTSANCGACGQVCVAGTSCLDGACTMLTFTATSDPPQFLSTNATSLFWTTQATFKATIEQALFADASAPMPIATNVWNPIALVADSNNAYYAQNYINNSATSFAVVQLPLDGGASTPLASPASQMSAVAKNSKTIFYATNNDGKIWSVPINGSSATPILANLTGLLEVLAADDNNVYYANGPNSQIVTRATTAGANATPLVTAQNAVTSIVVDATSVYYASDPDGIYSVPINGGSATRLGNWAFRLHQDATNLYFVQPDSNFPRRDVVRMSKSGGAQVVIASDETSPYQMSTFTTALGPSAFFAFASGTAGMVILVTPK